MRCNYNKQTASLLMLCEKKNRHFCCHHRIKCSEMEEETIGAAPLFGLVQFHPLSCISLLTSSPRLSLSITYVHLRGCRALLLLVVC